MKKDRYTHEYHRFYKYKSEPVEERDFGLDLNLGCHDTWVIQILQNWSQVQMSFLFFFSLQVVHLVKWIITNLTNQATWIELLMRKHNNNKKKLIHIHMDSRDRIRERLSKTYGWIRQGLNLQRSSWGVGRNIFFFFF